MEQFLLGHASWYALFLVVGLLLAFYFVLILVQRQLDQLSMGASTKNTLTTIFRRILLFYTPFAVLLAIGIFGAISPLWNGILLLLVIAISFPLLRNYWIGILLQYDSNFHIGKGIWVGSTKGDINKMNALGIYIMTANGIQYFSYSHIQQDGFSLVADNDTKEYCYLNIHSTDKTDIHNRETTQNLFHKLLQTPYLDTRFSPVFVEQKENQHLQVKVLLRPGGHKKEIVALIETWNYHCTLSY